MSARQSNSPDAAAALTVLREAADLCRRLDLPKEAALFDGFVDRFRQAPPSFDVLRDEVYDAVNGLPGLSIFARLKDDPSPYNRLQLAFSRVAFPEHHEPEKPRQRREWKAVRDSAVFWQLDGESDLRAVTIPHPPRARTATTIRLTYSNAYGPFDEVEFFVRAGDPDKPTAPQDLDSASNWVPARLVEELVSIDGEEMPRSEAQEPFEDETPWEGTYDAQLAIPDGRRSIEIKIVSRHPELLRSLVLTGWDVTVGHP